MTDIDTETTAPVDEPWDKKPKRKSSAEYPMESIGFDLPEDEEAERAVARTGFREHFADLVEKYESGEIARSPETGYSEWVVIGTYDNRIGAKSAAKTIAQSVLGAANGELDKKGRPYKSVYPAGWRIEIRVHKPKTGSRLLARVIGRAD